MKFAKELEQDLVPEWRIKYLNYKAGKKYVKSVARALKAYHAATPSLSRRSGDLPPHPTPSFATPRRATDGRALSEAQSRRASQAKATVGNGNGNGSSNGASNGVYNGHGTTLRPPTYDGAGGSSSANMLISPAKTIPASTGGGEKDPLTRSPGSGMQYGSFVATPPGANTPLNRAPTHPQYPFELPAPAIKVPSHTSEPPPKKPSIPSMRNPFQRSFTTHVPPSKSRPRLGSQPGSGAASPRSTAPHHAVAFSDNNGGEPGSNGGNFITGTPRRRLTRIFSTPSPLVRMQTRGVLGPQYEDELRLREEEFFAFLDSELHKVETFYRQKEEHAGQRLALLREQLHVMRNRRTHEIAESKKKRREAQLNILRGGNGNGSGSGSGTNSRDPNGQPHYHRLNQDDSGEGGVGGGGARGNGAKDGAGGKGWMEPMKSRLFVRPGPNSKALQKMSLTPHMHFMNKGDGVQGAKRAEGGTRGAAHDLRRDYIRRPDEHDVPYRTAKHKLKLALQEFYRGLELLKSYALLNRTAFRKLNKKYDKAVNARPPYRYMNERVNKSYFVTSTALDDHITAVEDLYARYFEGGNHKVAAGKLRSLSRRPGDESASAFRSGLLIGVGVVFAVQGLTYGSELLFDEDEGVRQQTSYLMQIYAGYFLMLYLFILFCIDCRIWTRNKINYHFIFEFDARSQLDWRQLSEFPSFFMLVFGVFIWINFSRLGAPGMYLYYPVIMICVTLLVLFFPAPLFFYRSRRWFLYSHWRLLLAGIYPVEFRDFFLGDIYCSLTYAMCNVELFFCLYYRAWNDPEQCNSSHSRLLGFLATLPAIWRALQCIRRYYDTRNVFPHLVNCGKYSMTILATVCLSLYRIDNTRTALALFIAFSSINAVYCSIWDLFMDFSLLQPSDHHFLLRDIVALKRRWPYYAAMVADPVLRFSWIFYAIFTHNTQHSTVVSFLVALAEITRRGMWTIFRVENEHCANVAQYKASRDVPLPYHLDAAPPAAAAVAAAGADHRPPLPGAAAAAGATPSGTIGTGKSTAVEFGGGALAGGPGQAPTTPAVSAVSAAEEGLAGPTLVPGELRPSGTMRRRDTLVGGISRIMAEAHRQDFEKKRRPADEGDSAGGGGGGGGRRAATAALGGGGRAMGVDGDDEDEEDGACFSNDEGSLGGGSGSDYGREDGGGANLDDALMEGVGGGAVGEDREEEEAAAEGDVLDRAEIREAEELGRQGGGDMP